MSQARTRTDYFYWQIVLRHFRSFIQLYKEIETSKPPFDEKGSKKILEDLEKGNVTYKELEPVLNDPFFDNLYMIRICSTIITTFSALCLESLINDYGIIKTSSTYFKNYLDKLDTASKWVVIPRIINGTSIPTDGKAFELIKDLYSRRNKLVHPKSTLVDNQGENMVNDFFEVGKSARVSILAVKEATKALYDLDKSFKYLSFYKPFWSKGKFEKTSSLEKLYHSMASSIREKNI